MFLFSCFLLSLEYYPDIYANNNKNISEPILESKGEVGRTMLSGNIKYES